jgi:hypothetical protein
MENLLIIGSLSFLALAVILFYELKITQRRLEEIRGEVEQQVRRSLSDAAEPMQRIPVLEQRLGNVERDVAHLQPAPANAAESEKLLAAKDAG